MENKTVSKGNGKKKKIIFSIIGGVILSIVLIISLRGKTESTDNAQLDADIIPIRSSVSGYIQAIHFKDNQQVKKGQLLISIDDTELKTRVAQAQAALTNAQANLNAVKSSAQASDFNASAANFTSASSLETINAAKARLLKVKEDYKRIKNMYALKAATTAEFDSVTAELAVAQAQYDAALKQQQASKAQSEGVHSQATGQVSLVALAQALVHQREAELTLAKTQLEYATIEAPSDGIVSKRSVEVGQFIMMGQPLCSTIDNSIIWVAANFKETQLTKMKLGQTVRIKIDAYPDMNLTGKLNSFIGATGSKFSLLPPDNATGNFVKIVQRVPVKITIDKLTKAQLKKLFPGLSAFVAVKVD